MSESDTDFSLLLHPELRTQLLAETKQACVAGRQPDYWALLDGVFTRCRSGLPDYVALALAQMAYEQLERHFSSQSDKLSPLPCKAGLSEAGRSDFSIRFLKYIGEDL